LLIGYLWDETTNKWVYNNKGKGENTYNANANMTLTIHYSWDEFTRQWVVSNKEEYTYNANGNLTLEIFYNNWDLITSQWQDISKEEYTYDAKGNNTSYSSYNWDETDSLWVCDQKREFTYDANGNRTLFIFYLWDEFTSQMVVNSRTTYYYSEHNITFVPKIPENHISVYPNPASEYIVFEVTNISEPALVEIFDNQGKKVLQQKLSENKHISVGKLPKGLYMYKLNNSGNIYTGKVIVK